jgi:hypothetical protein
MIRATTLEHDITEPDAKLKIAPASFGQERLWVVYQLDRDSVTYNMRVVHGSLNVELLQNAFDVVEQRQDSLRIVPMTEEEEGALLHE